MALPPLILRWLEPHNPLPVRAIQAGKPAGPPTWFAQQSPADSGQPAQRPFDFCVAIQRLMMDIAIRSPDFRYLHTPRILVSVTQARGNHAHGLQARVTPLRFDQGSLIRKRRGTQYQIQRFFLGEHEYLYVMTFCLPRFLDQEFDQKLVTLFHELYHISPAFDGDLRRHEGRYAFHSHSKRAYDERMVQYAREYLAGKPDPAMHGFLRMNFSQLQDRHRAVTGIVVPRPKMIPLVGSI